ncbi:hypothetical protein LDENG_00093750 [Lucifuga dentata]|nr:hypothetical protein LDENG_00093750 [Lucifuga dentata]
MDNTIRHEKQPPLFYNGGYLEAPYAASRAPQPGTAAQDPLQPDQAAQWTPSPEHVGPSYGFRCDFPPAIPGLRGFGGSGFSHPYAFDPSVPPPPFICPPSGFSSVCSIGPLNSLNSTGASDFNTFTPNFSANCGSGPQSNLYDFHQDSNPKQQHEYQDFRGSGGDFAPWGNDRKTIPGKAAQTHAADEKALQRRQDELWLKSFLQSRATDSQSSRSQRKPRVSVGEMRDALYGAVRLVSELSHTCETLRDNLQDEAAWTESHVAALRLKEELQGKLRVLGDREALSGLEAAVSRAGKRKARRQRARVLQRLEETREEQRVSEKEAEIDKWRMKQIHAVEEKKKEQELKLAADSVLCEVRKKQADVKRMQDILRSLEKLRKLRTEAASRKGIFTDPESDEAFSSQLEKLRSVMMKRMAVYSVEEKALMVMLEGEQEEERRREREKRQKKEKERHLRRKQQVDAMLFGDELPAVAALQPFREFHTQAERSLHALLQIRRQWDVFLVAADHPDGSSLPTDWILPDAPSLQLHKRLRRSPENTESLKTTTQADDTIRLSIIHLNTDNPT